MAMTLEELKSTVLGTVKEYVGSKEVYDVIETSARKALEAQNAGGPPSWAAALFGKPAEQPKKREKGEGFARILRANIQARFDPERAVAVLRGWGDADLADGVQKAMTAGTPIAGGFIVPEGYSQDIIELLRAPSIIRRLGPMVVPMPTGSLRIPKVTAGATGYYVGESSNITPSQLTLGQITLNFKKLAAIVPLSNDLLRYSSPGADAIVRDDAVRAISATENSYFLRSTGASGPKGLRYWVLPTNLIKANSTVNIANVTTDLGKLVNKLMVENTPFTRAGWIMSPRSYVYLTTLLTANSQYAFREEMMNGRLWGWPFAVTTSIPENLTDSGGVTDTEVYLCDFADVVLGEGLNLSVDASSEAAYYDGSNVVAAFSRDETVVRIIEEHDLAMRRDTSLAILNQVTWGA